MSAPESNAPPAAPADFLRQAVAEDIQAGKIPGEVVTRWPPEPNGYLHIGHAKACGIDFGIAQEFGGHCNLRYDDTNPAKEEQEFIDSIKDDLHWLGCDWGANEFYASDYFETLYEWAVMMIKAGKAYVCQLTNDQMREYRGTFKEPGKNSPWRDRPVEESLDLFARMKAGEFEEGAYVLRAKIDMADPNIVMRDPTMYRIVNKPHPRQGTSWHIYAMYDWAHGQSDWIEGVTHSLCSQEYEIHRPLYNWYIDTLIELGARPEGVTGRPRQIEFARLNLTRTVMSKRRLRQLVEEGHVRGWDDPRMPTLSGLRRRGYTPEAVRDFCRRIGVAKADSIVEIQMLEHCLREDLNKRASRYMAVLRPLKVTITNWPDGQVEMLDAVNNPEDESAGTRKVPFTGELYIEQGDFMEEPPKKFFRLAPGREVRFRWAYFITCNEVVKNEAGEAVELKCTYDPETRGGNAPDGRKVKATIHWVSAAHAVGAEVRCYDYLFTKDNPDEVDEGLTWLDNVDPSSLEVLTGCKLEPALLEIAPGARVQFERLGYFTPDSRDHSRETPVFNRAVGLRDAWAKQQKKKG